MYFSIGSCANKNSLYGAPRFGRTSNNLCIKIPSLLPIFHPSKLNFIDDKEWMPCFRLKEFQNYFCICITKIKFHKFLQFSWNSFTCLIRTINIRIKKMQFGSHVHPRILLADPLCCTIYNIFLLFKIIPCFVPQPRFQIMRFALQSIYINSSISTKLI